jgi:hypothetical protein
MCSYLLFVQQLVTWQVQAVVVAAVVFVALLVQLEPPVVIALVF